MTWPHIPSGAPFESSQGFPAKSREPGRSFNKISFFSIIFLDTDEPAPYIGSVNARSAPAAAGRRSPKRSKRRNRRRTVRDRSVFPALRPAASRPSCAPPYAPLGLTAGPRPIRPSGSTLRFRRAIVPPILPGGAAPGVDRRSRSARRLEKFLSKVFLRTSEKRLSNDSKGLGLPGAKKTYYLERSV